MEGKITIPYVTTGIPVMAMCMLLGFRSAEEVATCVATGGLLSGHTAIPAKSGWDTPDVRTTRLWVLSMLRDKAGALPPSKP